MPSRLSSLLVRDGLVGVKRMEKAFQRQVIYGGSLDTILLEMNLLPEERLTQYLALASGLPLIAPDWGGSAQMADPAVSQTYRAGETISLAAAITQLFARDPVTLRAASLRVAHDVRTDSQHYADLFAHYEDRKSVV